MFELNRVTRVTHFCARALSIALVGAVALVVASVAAHANSCRDRNFVDALELELRTFAPVRATSSDGKTYDNIESESFQAAIGVDLCYPGALNGVILHLGTCTGHGRGCDSKPVMYQYWPLARDWSETLSFSFAIPPDSDAGARLLEACNAGGGDVSAAFPFGMSVDVTLGVGTRRDELGLDRWDGPGWPIPSEGASDTRTDPYQSPLPDYSKTKSFRPTLSVECAPLPEEAKAPPPPVSVNLSVDPKGETCPKETEVTTWIYYDQPSVAQFRFKLDGELSGLYTRETEKIGGPGTPKGGQQASYLVKETKTYYLDPGQHHFRVEVRGGKKSEVITRRIECPPFKVTSAWLKYDVEDKPTCPKEVDEKATFRSTRPGKAPFEIKTQGGLVVHSGTAVFERKGKAYVAEVKRDLSMNAFDQDMMALIKNDLAANSGWTRLKVECTEVLSGTLDLREFAATRCEGEAAFSIRTNMPGEVPYQLDCTGGRSWSGTAQTQQTGTNTYLGVDLKRFDVTNNEQVNCALKTRDPFPVKVLALKGNKYACHRPSGASGTSDLAPDPGRPDVPPPVNRLTGDFSFVDYGSPRCPRNPRALINFVTDRPDNVHYSLDCTHGSFSGVAQTAKSPNGGFIAPALVSFPIKQTTQASCALKTVAPGNPKVHTVKGHLFQCVTPTGVPGASDLVPPTRPDPLVPSGPGRIVVDPPRTPSGPTGPKIVCTGGRISGAQCVCARGFNPVQAGSNAFRCVKIVTFPGINTPGLKVGTPSSVIGPKIACAGGFVRSNVCVCPAGRSLRNGVCTVVSNAPTRTGGKILRLR